ncbi:STAS domain-containing protein [Azonexus sp.]|uniref:STAS domain-containing protein n=1 Tax=Azonexus sp. TaxID=1872668 RepID=UPI0035AE89DA
MVFSFFKKQPEKVVPKATVARPRTPLPEMKVPPPQAGVPQKLEQPLPDLEFSVEEVPPVKAPPPAKPAKPPVSPSPVPGRTPLAMSAEDDFDGEFTTSSVMAIDVVHDIDPLQADVEQVAVLFANSQDDAARALLLSVLKTYSGSEGIRLWRMLFDLLQIQGDRAAFDRFGMEFARSCEMSPPAWRDAGGAGAGPASAAKGFTLQGVLAGDDSEALQQLDASLKQAGDLLVDCSRLVGCDDIAAGLLADVLIAARRSGKVVTLQGADIFARRLEERLKTGEPVHESAWRLLLELLQRLDTQAHFEEKAVDYAITFELSPPSWETLPKDVVAKQTALAAVPKDEVYYLAGELKGLRFDELLPLLEAGGPTVIDFAAVRRVDFYSAGQLVNRLAPFKAAGQDIVIRSPNHLVAELMAVVGLNKQARIIVPKS